MAAIVPIAIVEVIVAAFSLGAAVGGFLVFGALIGMVVYFWKLPRHLRSEIGPLGGFGQFSAGRLVIMALLLVDTFSELFGIRSRFDLPFDLSALVGALAFIAVWASIGRIGRYHLLAGIVTGLAVFVFSPPVSGTEFPGPASTSLEPSRMVWAVLLAAVAFIDYRLLQDLRDIAATETPLPVESSPE